MKTIDEVILQEFAQDLIKKTLAIKDWKDTDIDYVSIDKEGRVCVHASYTVKGCWEEDQFEFDYNDINSTLEQVVEKYGKLFEEQQRIKREKEAALKQKLEEENYRLYLKLKDKYENGKA